MVLGNVVGGVWCVGWCGSVGGMKRGRVGEFEREE